MKVIILAGGLGTRLRSVINDVPKPMADINGTPFLEILMENMLHYGAEEFVLCVSYLREKIISYFGAAYKGVPIRYSVEEEPLGTGGALKQAFDKFGLESALVINGDTFVQMDYAAFYNKYSKNILSVALKNVENAARYGLVDTDGKHILQFHEKTEQDKAGLVNAGVYCLNKNIRQYAPQKQAFSFEKEILEKHVKEIQAGYAIADDYFIDIGIPESYKRACRELKYHIGNNKQKALFLDRDGVINVDKHHVYKIEDCEFVEGIFDLCREAKSKGYLLIVITNQAGIAKGIYTEEDYFKFRDYVHQEFAKQGCPIDAEYYCPYHKEAVIEKYRKESPDRKPNPGMIFRAATDWNIDLTQSILIGDKESDIEAGKTAGVGKNIRFINKRFIYNAKEKINDIARINALKQVMS